VFSHSVFTLVATFAGLDSSTLAGTPAAAAAPTTGPSGPLVVTSDGWLDSSAWTIRMRIT
jgi:hypothetical protein